MANSEPSVYPNGVFVRTVQRPVVVRPIQQSVASAAASSPTVFTR